MRIRSLALCSALVAAAAVAETHDGTLASGDATRDGGQYVDTYTFQAQESQRVTVTMTGDSFDTYLIVESPGGEQFANDDYQGASVSRVDLLVTEAGSWKAMASSYGGGESGDYELEIDLGATGESEVTQGRLDTQDTMGIKGEYYDTYTIQVEPGVEFFVELASLGFDGYLAVRSPSGQMWRNDDAGGTSLSRVGPLTGEAGDWTVYATSNGPEEVGAYDLRVIRFE